MTKTDMEKEILLKLVEDLCEFNKDHLALMTEICDSPEQTQRWRTNRDILNKVEKEFDDLLLVRSGKEPVFGSLG